LRGPVLPFTGSDAVSLDRKRNRNIIGYTNHTFYTERIMKMNGPKGKYAWTATVGEKGQIVIPKQAREIFGIKPGDTLLLLGDEKQGIAIPPKGAFAELFNLAFSEKSED
jgi:AbrB family looped-hinge helix DNA binding protein